MSRENLKRSKITYYTIPKEDELSGGDFQQLLSFMFAFVGTWMRVFTF